MTRAWAVDGRHWSDQPRPRWWHRCKPATLGLDQGTMVARCACGGIRIGSGQWLERNSRRRSR